MGLITKEVEVVLSGENIKYYESLGYSIPRREDKWHKGRITIPRGVRILVKIKDLQINSNAKVIVQCDNDGCKINNPYLPPMNYHNYNMCVKEDGKYYCQSCAMKLFGVKKGNITKLKNGRTFEQWCIEHDKQDVLDRWDYKLNNCKPSEISYGTKNKYYFKCPRGIHESELKNIASFSNGRDGVMDCKFCNSFAQWGIDNICEDFLDRYWDYEENIVNPYEVTTGNEDINIFIKCQNKHKPHHGSYNTSASRFIRGQRCQYCSNKTIHYLDSLGTLFPYVTKTWSSRNKKSPFEYSPRSEKKIWWRCENNIHKEFRRDIKNSNKCGFRCPSCSRERDESFLQEKVRLYLKELEFTILHERNCTIVPKNPRTNNDLPFDNEVKELKLIIETMGIQHYILTGFHKSQAKRNNTTPGYEFYYIVLKDRFKRVYAISKGCNYLEIPYWCDDENETWKQMINEKIQSIKLKYAM